MKNKIVCSIANKVIIKVSLLFPINNLLDILEIVKNYYKLWKKRISNTKFHDKKTCNW